MATEYPQNWGAAVASKEPTKWFNSRQKGTGGFADLREDIRVSMLSVEDQFTGASIRALEVRVATSASLGDFTPAGSGVGKTLTAQTNIVLPLVDGVQLAVGDRLLVKDEASNIHHGIYVVTSLGVDGVSPWVLTRAADADENNELPYGTVVPVASGDDNKDKFFQLVSKTINIDSSGLDFVDKSTLLTNSVNSDAYLQSPRTELSTEQVVILTTAPGANDVAIDLPAGSWELIDAHIVLQGAGGGSASVQVKRDTNGITDAMAATGALESLVRAASISQDFRTLTGGTHQLVASQLDALAPSCDVYIKLKKLS